MSTETISVSKLMSPNVQTNYEDQNIILWVCVISCTLMISEKDIFRVIDKNPSLFSEFYGENIASKFKEIYEKYSQYKIEFNTRT